MSASLQQIAAVGAGHHGPRHRDRLRYAGHDVALIDIKARDAASLARLEQESLDEITSSLSVLASLRMFDAAEMQEILTRVHFVGRDGAAAALAHADTVFEGVPELIDPSARHEAPPGKPAGLVLRRNACCKRQQLKVVSMWPWRRKTPGPLQHCTAIAGNRRRDHERWHPQSTRPR